MGEKEERRIVGRRERGKKRGFRRRSPMVPIRDQYKRRRFLARDKFYLLESLRECLVL